MRIRLAALRIVVFPLLCEVGSRLPISPIPYFYFLGLRFRVAAPTPLSRAAFLFPNLFGRFRTFRFPRFRISRVAFPSLAARFANSVGCFANCRLSASLRSRLPPANLADSLFPWSLISLRCAYSALSRRVPFPEFVWPLPDFPGSPLSTCPRSSPLRIRPPPVR